MKLVAVTGGIASGKSTVSRGLAKRLRAPWVSCDEIVNGLYGEEQVLAAVRGRFGDGLFPQGRLNRPALGSMAFSDPEARRWLESLLHPLVLGAIVAWRRRLEGEARSVWGLVEVPLLYEVDFPLKRDIDVVVGCSPSTQLERIKRRDQLGEEQAQSRIRVQLPIERKVIRADVVLWNDGARIVLERLMDLAADRIQGIRIMTTENAEDNLPGQEQAGTALAETQPPQQEDLPGLGKPEMESDPVTQQASPGAEVPGEPAPAGLMLDGQKDPAGAEQPSPPPAAPPAKVEPPVPALADLNEFHERPLAELHRLALEAELRVAGIRSKHQLLFELLSYYLRRGTRVEAEGVLEFEKGGYGFLRWIKYSFAPQPDNLYVSQGILKRFNLREGTKLKVTVRGPKDREKFMAVEEVLAIEEIPVAEWKPPKPFDSLTPLFPKDRIILEVTGSAIMTARIVDLIAPLGKGQRGLIVAPPRGGKTLLLKDIAKAIHANYPEIELIVLLLDERPEEVTDFQEAVEVPIFSSTFDEVPKRHIQVAEMVSARAKRLVELGKDVVILLDSLTRLSRGYNQVQGGGRIMSGGIGAGALEKPRKFFGAARNLEEGGSLTILATALVETENRMDEVIFEEFKGTGNMEVSLDRELVEKRIFPAIHLSRSGTRNDEKLYHPDEFRRITVLRRELAQTPAVEAIEVLMRNIRNTSSNAELLLKGLK